MSIKYRGKKLTANQYAKLLISNAAQNADYWLDYMDDEKAKITQKEIEAIYKAIAKQQERIDRILGMEKIWDKPNS